ncbi:MAG: helix-turn-helix domain-containing protein [Janthinobacterium lividum]
MSRSIDAHIGRRLTRRRENLGLCCRELAEKVQLSEALIRAFEAGHVRIGSSDLVLLAEALKVNISYFYSN